MKGTPVIRSLGLRHVALKVRNFEKAIEFYREFLGFSEVWRPDDDNLYLSSGPDNLALHRDAAPGAGGSLDHIGILVGSPEEVHAAARDLASRGVEVLKAARTHRDGSVSCYVADPDGNSVQILFEPRLSAQRLPD